MRMLAACALCVSAALSPCQPSAAQAPAAKEKAPAATVAGAPTHVVTVRDFGATDRAPLRYRFAKGAKETMKMTMDLQTEITVDGQKAPSTRAPVITMEADGMVTNVEANGSADVTFTFSRTGVDPTGVDPQMQAMLGQMLKSMEGTVVKTTLTTRGLCTRAEVMLPPGAAPSIQATIDGMKQSLSEMCLPLPEEAVGAGARWDVEMNLTSGGITMQQTNRVTLRERTGDSLVLDIEISQKADAQDVQSPQLPPGAKYRLNSLSGTGKGRSAIKLSSTVPTRADVTSDALINSSVTVAANVPAQTMVQSMKMKMTIENATAAAP